MKNNVFRKYQSKQCNLFNCKCAYIENVHLGIKEMILKLCGNWFLEEEGTNKENTTENPTIR